LIPQHQDYLELLRILGDARVRSTTIITSRDRFCEADLNLEHYRLSGLDLAAWQEYFQAAQINCGEVLTQIHRNNIDLWELSTATELFQQAIDLAHNTQHHPWSEKARLGLALVNSYQGKKFTDPTVSRLYRLISELEDPTYNTGRFAYFIQMLGQIFGNQQQIEPARKMWQRAIAFSQTSHYTQIKAKSFTGLGNIESLNNNFIQANIYHQQAVELLDKIAAKCDLAEAYFQWGITLQANQQITQSRECWHKAIAIYQQIPAPKQVARVEKQQNWRL
jgi:tetratricopeptide (TPR) repeat protein